MSASVPHPEIRQLVVRYTRGPEGELIHSRKYAGKRDDQEIMHVKPLAFAAGLETLPEEKRKEYLAFEAAYSEFYALFTGSGLLENREVSYLLNDLQRDFERLRSALSARLAPDPQDS